MQEEIACKQERLLQVALLKIRNRLRHLYHEHATIHDQKHARKFLTQASIMEAIKIELDMYTNKKFTAELFGTRNNMMFFRTANGTISITEDIFYHDVDFPEDICDEDGYIKIGNTLHLFQNAKGDVYPDKSYYKSKRDAKISNNQWTASDYEAIQLIPHIPYYKKNLIKILLDRIDEFGQDVVESYIDELITGDKDAATKRIYAELHLPFFALEGDCIEFKSSLKFSADPDKNQNRVIANTIAGMLNSSFGGKLIIGVSDRPPHLVIGLNNEINPSTLNETEGILRHMLYQMFNNIDAINSLEFAWLRDWQDKIILVITIPANYDEIVLVNRNNLYVRSGSNTQLLVDQDMVRFMTNRNKKSA